MGAPMTDGARITQLQVKVEELEGELDKAVEAVGKAVIGHGMDKMMFDRDRHLKALEEVKRKCTDARDMISRGLKPNLHLLASDCKDIATVALREE